MTFTLDSINWNWDGMKYVLQKRPLYSLHFSTSLLNSGAPPARLLAPLAPLARSVPASLPPALEAPVPSLARPILLNVSPREARCEAPSAALLASQIARLLVGALRASPPLVCLTRFAGHHSGSSELLGLGVLAHRRCRCAPVLALRPPPLVLPSHLSSPCLFNSTNRENASYVHNQYLSEDEGKVLGKRLETRTTPKFQKLQGYYVGLHHGLRDSAHAADAHRIAAQCNLKHKMLDSGGVGGCVTARPRTVSSVHESESSDASAFCYTTACNALKTDVHAQFRQCMSPSLGTVVARPSQCAGNN